FARHILTLPFPRSTGIVRLAVVPSAIGAEKAADRDRVRIANPSTFSLERTVTYLVEYEVGGHHEPPGVRSSSTRLRAERVIVSRPSLIAEPSSHSTTGARPLRVSRATKRTRPSRTGSMLKVYIVSYTPEDSTWPDQLTTRLRSTCSTVA